MKLLHLRNAAFLLRSPLAFAFVALGAAATHGFAQTTSISGSVQDTQKAQISGAKVSITRTESGEHRETTSNDDGFFIFPVLIPGHYDLKVEKDSFGSDTKLGVQVLTGQTSVVDVILQAGQIQQSVDVQSDSPLLQTTSSAISNVIENETIVNLPLLDRRATQLQRLNGFVIGSGTGSGSTFAIAGGRGNNANYMVDGGTTQNLLQGVPTQMFDLPIDSLQEFNLTVSDYTADLGRSGGGVIQMTTKSGTNDFHGSAYLYYRSNNLQARPLFATVNPPLQYKLFGASIGGPIIRNRTHFFFTYEGKLATTTSVVTLNVPTAAERTGDFSAIATPVIDPYTGKQAIGDDGTLNKLPSAELDPYGVMLASYYPLPNIATASINSNNFTANDPATATINDYVLRIDHVFREKDTVYGRFLAQPDHTVTANVYSTPGTDGYGTLSHNYYYNPSVTWNHIFTPSLINEARFTYSRRQSLSISNGVNAAVNSDLSLPGINPKFFPGVSLSSLSSIGNTSQQQRLQTPIISNEYANNLSWQRGNHQLKFGVNYRTSADGDIYSPSGGGFFTFNNTGVSSNAAVGSLANLVLGRVASATRQETQLLYSAGWSWGLYAQDNWHVNSKLTFNYGLRWDIDSPRYLTNNRQNSFDTTAINPVSNTPGVITFSGINGQSKYANNFDYHNFGPRLGFAYTPQDRSVIRGGGAILFPGEYDQATPIVDYTGFSNAITLQSANPGVGTPAFLLKNNATDGTGKAAVPTLDQLTTGFGAVAVGQKPTVAPQFIQPKRQTGYLYQANLDVQHEFKGSLLLDIGYLGTFGHHLSSVSAESINQINPANQATLSSLPSGFNTQTLRPFPQFSNVQVLYPDIGQSRYNGVNIGVQKRYSHGLQYQVNYTFSKFIDNEVARNELAGYPGTDTYTDYYNPKTRFGLSGNDVRQRLIGNALYELPFGRGKLVNVQSGWLNEIVGGWTIGALTEVHSGTALGVIDATNNTGTYSDGVRPNLTGNPNGLSKSRSRAAKTAEWFDTSAFTQNAAFTFGDAPRTFGRGPRLVTSDASLLKKLQIRESNNLEFRLEASNVFNHASLGNPSTQFGSANFGRVSTLQPGGVASRTLQLAAHYTF
jgi:hypothetical protein